MHNYVCKNYMKCFEHTQKCSTFAAQIANGGIAQLDRASDS